MPATRPTAAERSAEELKLAQQRKDAAESDDSPAVKARNLMSDRVGLHTSDARVRNHLKFIFTPYEIGVKIQDLCKKRRDAHEAGNAAVVASCKAEIAELNKEVVRIGGDAPMAIAAVVDRIVIDITEYCFSIALSKQRKTAEVAYMHDEGCEGLATYPLFRDLPVIRGYDPDEEAQLRIDQAAANKDRKEADILRRADREAVVAAAVLAGEEPPPVHKTVRATVSDDDLDNSMPTTTFNTYVESAIRSVRTSESNPEYSQMRVSARFRDVVVELAAQFVRRMAELARIQVLETAGARTLTSQHVKTVIRTLFTTVYGSDPNPELEQLMVFISSKVSIFHQIAQASKDVKATKKADDLKNMSEQERLELQKKATDAAEAKRTKSLAAAQTRAVAAAAQIAALSSAK
jgi:hypothetical protein